MTFPSRSRWLAVVAAALMLLVLALPGLAFADSLTWTQTYYGPSDLPNPNPELDDIAVAARLNAVAFFDGTHGWAVGTWTDAPSQSSLPKYGLAAFTDNGGATWTTSTAPGTELIAVAMPDTDKVFATSAVGTIVTRNGTSWVTKTVSGWPTTGSRALRGIAFTDPMHGWAVGDLGGIAKTTDGGTTWTTVVAPATGGTTLYAIARVDTSKCIAVGAGGAARAITSSGVTSVSSATSNLLRGVTFTDAGNGWAVGDNGTMVRTADGGAHWTSSPVSVPGYTPAQLMITSVAFADALNGVAVGQYQQVWRTFDGGDTWSNGEVPGGLGDSELRGAAFVPGDNAHPVVVGAAYKALLSHSADKARAWRGDWSGRVTPPPAAPINLMLSDAGAPGLRIRVAWSDRSSAEDGFAIERSIGSASGPWTGVATTTANVTSWTDSGISDWTTTHYYRVRSFNGIGPSTWTAPVGLKVDTTAPITSSDAAPVYVASATITLAPTDDRSGVASTEWTLDGQPGNGTVVETSAVGPHTLQFRSTDIAGNVEQWGSLSFYVSNVTVPDSTAPQTSLVGSLYPYYTVPATISFSASDGTGAGVFATYVSLDGKPAVNATKVSVSSTGTHRISYRSIDYAGNAEATKTISFTALIRPSSTGQPSRPVTPLTVSRSKSFTTYGYIRRYSKTYSVRLYFYRYESGKWVYKTYDSTAQYRVSVPGDDFNKYKASTTLTKTGKWRVRARRVVGSKTIYSAYQYFTVK